MPAHFEIWNESIVGTRLRTMNPVPAIRNLTTPAGDQLEPEDVMLPAGTFGVIDDFFDDTDREPPVPVAVVEFGPIVEFVEADKTLVSIVVFATPEDLERDYEIAAIQ